MSSQNEINLFELMEERRLESKQEHQLLHKRVSDMKDELLQEIRALREQQQAFNERMDKRVTALERWKWGIVGGAAVAMFFLMGVQNVLLRFIG